MERKELAKKIKEHEKKKVKEFHNYTKNLEDKGETGKSPNGKIFNARKAYENGLISYREMKESIMRFKEVIIRAKAISVKGIQGRAVYVWYSNKWYPVANCGTHGMPTVLTAARAIRTLMLNTGSYDRCHRDPTTKSGYFSKFNPNKGVFGGKKIVLKWQYIENIYPKSCALCNGRPLVNALYCNECNDKYDYKTGMRKEVTDNG